MSKTKEGSRVEVVRVKKSERVNVHPPTTLREAGTLLALVGINLAIMAK